MSHKTTSSTNAGDDPWQTLLDSEYHKCFMLDNLNVLPDRTVTRAETKADMPSLAHQLIDVVLSDGSLSLKCVASRRFASFIMYSILCIACTKS
jgi:hypothetical protein